MKKVFLIFMLYVSCQISVFCAQTPALSGNEPVKLINPDKNTKVEIMLKSHTKEFGGKLDVISGSGDFAIILCDDKGAELKRTKVNEDGQYSFGEIDAGKHYLKFENTKPAKIEQQEDKAAPNIMELPYLRESKFEP